VLPDDPDYIEPVKVAKVTAKLATRAKQADDHQLALQRIVNQAKKEALLEAADQLEDYVNISTFYRADQQLRRMAEEIMK
jgi:uncharacterized protein YpiB (UPF0302 family)